MRKKTVIKMIRKILFFIVALFTFTLVGYSQSERKAVRQGNREFKKQEFLDSEISYRSALDINPSSFKANFNLGDALYKQEKFEEAAQLFDDLSNLNIEPNDKAKVYHNLGNSHFNLQNFGESVEAYKNALRYNPNDMETKYNLAQAQRMLMEQEQEQEQSSDGDGEGEDDQKDNQQDQDKQNEQEDDQQQDQQDDQQQQDDREQEISPEDARRILEAIQKNEQDIQERVKEEQAKQQRVKVEKNW